ncbi:DUF2750 domain-containing protein [Cellvibrio japonicus]|uniref:DUF2750 domain-containing protein n=1 Tax=Cellvibrio japonicus (strain Ueda107) TaxID=498211 RepID=B3PDT2_CELJU|nr:DUF2750 domain-containing protein [Cellvibrio japonicus]ACE85945.1 hypothetical protein CJA_3134 [Cellvibrio japonicus Ueda107]QEI13419.1 DUF2750 domain-containing protein [Cellvibrio japonicus]QEI16993.1 DUF2750 domain-containing protein [Cellvibrio japonicus]QEI20571.1 DUF2750 domain-containing protein [Cellvibrio japonicus]
MSEQVEPLSDDLDENLDRFIVEALERGCVWGLQGSEGWALCASEEHDDMDVMPFWSQESFARVHCVDDWAGYTPAAIDLGEFLEEWLPGMHEDLLLVGVNWNQELDGDEMEPIDLLEEFETEMGD